ncbi:MAG: flagellar hook capping FlgD N-terminal domain-containing protein [Pseudomonadota bacterium]|nr:flagellar hook capping FlgD N-terminal domain-containing protein [Pseudomonadota bacterium]
MSTVNPAASTQTTTQQSGVATSPTENPQIGEEFMSFIRLLTAQVQNQDPLEPMDSTQFVEQLATFSNLEQQVRGNESLESIATMIGDLHSMLASEWLGKTVSVESSWVPYSGEAVKYGFNSPDGADGAILNVRNGQGETVWKEILDLSDEQYSWDGVTNSGTKVAADSLMEFGIDLYQGETYLGTVAPQVITEVTDVASENGTLRLGTSSRLTADMETVRRLD